MLPAIANYFGITLDELFSMSEIRNREKINAIFERVHELETDKKTDEAIEILRKSYIQRLYIREKHYKP